MMLILLIMIGGSTILAQERLKFAVADFDLDPFDYSAHDKQHERFDGNGDRYAIIKVSTNNPDDNLNEYNFNFGNMKHIVEMHDGVLWIYVQRNAKLVTITRNGYVPINRYDLHTTIESGKNYVMSLTSEQKKVYTQMVRFNVKPANSKAVIMVKSFKEGSQEELFGNADASGSVARSLEYGTYTYKVLADNYHMAEGRFTLNNKSETLIENVDLRPNFSDMTFNVNADADIYINGERKGTRQWSGALKAGNYQVECRQVNHKPTSQYVQVTENDNRTINLTPPEPILGTASITSNPLGAYIKIDGKDYGQTPKNVDLLVGKHNIEFSQAGYKTEKQVFDVLEDKTVNLNATLSRTTKVEIITYPTYTYCSLYIDGKWQGHTPYTYEGEVGEHRIRLMSKGYRPITRKIYLGNTEKLTFSLQKQSVKSTDIYIEGGVGIGPCINAAVGVGTHIKNFNIELDYAYCFEKATVYWNNTNGYQNSISVDYKAPLTLCGKIGYGFIIGSRFKITPQVGYRYTAISSNFTGTTHCSSLNFGLRAFCAFSSHFGMSLTPEYALGIGKPDSYKTLSGVSSKIKNMAEGFNAKLSVVVTF